MIGKNGGSDLEVIPKVYKGHQCYQVTSTGEIGMSKDELAAVCNIHKTGITYIMNNVGGVKMVKFFGQFVGHDLVLIRKSFKGGGATVILRWAFCAAVMAYYREEKAQPKGKPDRRDRSDRKRKKATETASESLITSYYFPE